MDELNTVENPEQLNEPAGAPNLAAPQPIDDVIKSTEAKLKASADAPLKRKRGRPRKYQRPQLVAPAAVSIEPTAAAPVVCTTDFKPMIKDLAAMGSGILVEQFQTDEASLTQEEQDRLAIGLNPLFQKWFPEMGELSPELTAVLCCGSIAFSVYMRVKAENERKAQANAGPVTVTVPEAAAPAA